MGVFTSADIPEGTVVVRYKGKERWIWDIPRGLWERCLQVGYDRYVVPAKGSLEWYLNHSCDPNCGIRGEREIITLRRITSGEELTFDYSTNVGWEGFAMDCRCGAKDCRGTIRSYWNLSETLKKKYGGMVSVYLLTQKPPEAQKGPASYSRTVDAR